MSKLKIAEIFEKIDGERFQNNGIESGFGVSVQGLRGGLHHELEQM
jgi:hypothetical protein